MLLKYLRPHWLSIVIALIFTLLLAIVSAVVFSLLGPALKILMMPGVDQIITMKDLLGERFAYLLQWIAHIDQISIKSLWHTLPGLLLSLAALRAVLGTVQWFIWERASELVSKSLRNEIIEKYLYFDPLAKMGRDDSDGVSKLSSAITNDIRMAREYVVHFYGGLPRELSQIFLFMVTMVLLSPKLFVIFFAGVVPSMFFIDRMGKKLRNRAAKALSDNSALIEWLQQRMLGIETIKHYGTERLELRCMEDLNQNLYERFLKAARVKVRISPALELIAVTAMVGVLYFALVSSTSGSDASGSMQLSFFSTLAVLAQAAARVGRYYNANREGGAAIIRLQQLSRDLDEGRKEALRQVIPKQEDSDEILRMYNVTVTYPDAPAPALRNFSYCFRKGKIYVIFGPSGAGKSTLFNVLLGLVDPCAGKVEMSEVDFSGAHGKKAMSLVYVPQFVHLMPDTIAMNVAYPHCEADTLKVKNALTRVGLLEAVEELPQGMDTLVGYRGHGLSGGQMQRILLARIYYHRAPLVLIDEGTSALDPELEQLVYATLREISAEGCIVLMIAHRLAAATIAHAVLYLKEGCLITDENIIRQELEPSRKGRT